MNQLPFTWWRKTTTKVSKIGVAGIFRSACDNIWIELHCLRMISFWRSDGRTGNCNKLCLWSQCESRDHLKTVRFVKILHKTNKLSVGRGPRCRDWFNGSLSDLIHWLWRIQLDHTRMGIIWRELHHAPLYEKGCKLNACFLFNDSFAKKRQEWKYVVKVPVWSGMFSAEQEDLDQPKNRHMT